MSQPKKKQYLYHKDHNVIYGWIEETARQVRAGNNIDLIIIDEDHPLAIALLPQAAPIKRSRTPVEVSPSAATPA